MDKLTHIRRPVKIEDYNSMVDTINSIIDEISKKPTHWVDWIDENVENIKNYTNLDVELPYERSILISDIDSYNEISMNYHIPKEIASNILDLLATRVNVMFNISFKEAPKKELTISQGEVSLESLEQTIKKNATSKKWWKKKDGTTKSTGGTSEKDSWTSKGRIRKRKS